MAEYTYPTDVLDAPQQLMATLGSFWVRTYLAEDQIMSITLGMAQMTAQAQLDLLELIASMSRFEVPIWHTDNWYFLSVRESAVNSAAVNLAAYNGSRTFGDGTKFDVPPQSLLYAVPTPANLAEVSLVMNRITNPTAILTNGVDFTLDLKQNAIVFRSNPFENPLFATKTVYEGGEPVDRELALWLFRGQFDFDHIYRQFGYVLGVKLKSSKGYRDLLNGILDSIVHGPTIQAIEQALAVIAGTPLVQEPAETVEVVSSDAAGQLIITDQHVYRYSMQAIPRVAVGDVVKAGDSLVDAFEVIEFNRGTIPASIQALAIGKGLLSGCFYGDLIFDNKDVPLEVDETHPSGYTYLKFGLGGFPADVQEFFDEVHARGIAQREAMPDNACAVQFRVGTLAHLLDKRKQPDGEPKAGNLPSTINPLQFLVQNVLRNNAYLVRIKVSGMGPDAMGLYNVRHLRRVVPPHTAMLLLYEFEPPADTINANLVTDTVETFTALEPVQDTVGAGLVTDRVGLRMIGGTCQ